MNIRPLVAIGLLVLAYVLALTAWAWLRIPPAQLIPTHWDIHGHVNGRMTKTTGLLFGPAVMFVVSVIYLAVTRLEPRQNNLARSKTLVTVGWIGLLLVFAMTQTIVVFAALGRHVPVNAIVLPAVSLLLIVVGNAMPKSRANFFFGVRTPWTLESDYSWEKTNRWAGRFFVATGVAALVVLWGSGFAAGLAVIGAGVVASTIAAIALSYFFWRADPERRAHDSVPE